MVTVKMLSKGAGESRVEQELIFQNTPLIDTHAHLSDPKIDYKKVIADMPKDGLEKIVTVGYDMQSSRVSSEIAEGNADVYAAVGVHPSDVDKMKEEDLQLLLDMAKKQKTVAIGEIGLDYHYPNHDKQQQHDWLKAQLSLVKESGLPAIIHLRDAYEDMQKIIKDNIDKFPASAVLHCFSGSRETAEFYLSLGFFISFTGVVTYKNAAKLPEVVRAVPMDKLLIETDCPYLSPEPFRGQLNIPRNVHRVAEKIAEIKGISASEVARITTENAYKFFYKMKK
jgi:TatD DNase family protein